MFSSPFMLLGTRRYAVSGRGATDQILRKRDVWRLERVGHRGCTPSTSATARAEVTNVGRRRRNGRADLGEVTYFDRIVRRYLSVGSLIVKTPRFLFLLSARTGILDSSFQNQMEGAIESVIACRSQEPVDNGECRCKSKSEGWIRPQAAVTPDPGSSGAGLASPPRTRE